MSAVSEEKKILGLIQEYTNAFEAADADRMAALFWLDDPRFCEVENHIPEPFGKERFLWIMDWIRKNQPPGWKMRFYDTRVYLLSPDVAYVVSLREEEIEGERGSSRVTLIFLKKGGEWKIIHGHFSRLPD